LCEDVLAIRILALLSQFEADQQLHMLPLGKQSSLAAAFSQKLQRSARIAPGHSTDGSRRRLGYEKNLKFR
jgi:hypothetical protein